MRRLVLAAVLGIGTVLVAQPVHSAEGTGQEYVIETVFRSLVSQPIALRSAGTVLTADAVVPADAPDESYIRLLVDQDPADRVNPAIAFTYALERRLAPNWLLMCGGPWVGVDAFDDEYGLPYMPRCTVKTTSGVSDGQGGRMLRNKRGWRVRGHFELPQATSLGWRIDVITVE